MKVLDAGYTYLEVSQAFDIPRSSLRDHYLGKRRNRKRTNKGVLSNEEDEALWKYIHNMAEVAISLTPTQMQQKAVEMMYERPILFKEGICARLWLRWFLHRCPQISFRFLQALD